MCDSNIHIPKTYQAALMLVFCTNISIKTFLFLLPQKRNYYNSKFSPFPSTAPLPSVFQKIYPHILLMLYILCKASYSLSCQHCISPFYIKLLRWVLFTQSPVPLLSLYPVPILIGSLPQARHWDDALCSVVSTVLNPTVKSQSSYYLT